MLRISNSQYWVFDLDDTLYKEVEFLKSAYMYISHILKSYINKNIYDEMIDYYHNGESTFDIIKQKYNFPYSIYELVEMYRNHKPILELPSDTKAFLNILKKNEIKMGLITDGRSITQRNKIESLNIDSFFEKIIISEEFGFSKPSIEVFNCFDNKKYDCIYVADNTSKDFITPNEIGWLTLCMLDNGINIHKQNFNLAKKYLPQYKIKSFKDLISNIN
jgi:putative hydrolase of the HAD superfamily